MYESFSAPLAMTPPAQSEIAIAPASTAASQLAALLQTAGVSRLDQTGWIRVTGGDRVRWLNGMVTNSIQQLKDGDGAYNFFLNAQGRIQGDATVFAEPEALMVETDSARVTSLMTFLDRFIVMDDVELADVTSIKSGLQVTGPKAASLLKQIGLEVENPRPTHHTNRSMEYRRHHHHPRLQPFGIEVRAVDRPPKQRKT